MPTPQPGIFGLGTPQHHHLELDQHGDAQEVLEAIQRVREQAGTVAGVNVVVGFGRRLLVDIAPDDVPDAFEDIDTIEGAGGFSIPTTQHDLWIWLHGAAQGAVLDLARLAERELAGVASLAAEQQSFAYAASQDLTGFEDGTENPPLDEAAEVASVPGGGPGEGGSIVLVQRWIHDLQVFDALDVDERERVIGRTLADSIELAESAQPPDSHVSRVVIEDDAGEELEVFRRSTAFGDVGEHGLMFVAFSADQARLREMLERMAGTPDGIRDRLTEFSTPQRSAWYYAPPVEMLRQS